MVLCSSLLHDHPLCVQGGAGQESIVALTAFLCLSEKGGTEDHFFSSICLSISSDP